MRGIIFNGKNSIEEYGLYVNSLDISPPSKKRVKVEIPFMNGSYDFSNMYGENTFEDRTLSYRFEIVGRDASEMNYIKISVYNWLMSAGQCQLFDTAIEGYFFLAECVSVSESDDGEYSALDVVFDAYPFKIREVYEGDNLWDTFNFLTDYLQPRTFTSNGLATIEFYNPGAVSAIPTVITSANMEITLDGTSFVFAKGSSKNGEFKLKPGINKMILEGTGTVEFRFNSEVL